MVIVRLIGGLGNQLFQYAAARRLAHINSVPLKLDISEFARDSLRAYSLNHFNIREELASPEEIGHFKGVGIAIRVSRWMQKFLPYYRRSVVVEQHFHFDPRILKLSGDVYLTGYWQSEKYFKDIETLLRRELTVKTELDAVNAAMAERIRQVSAVSIHIRRDDYVSSFTTQQVHGACSLDYYYAAIDKLLQAIKEPHFFIFSDDPLWGQENLKLKYPVTFVTHNGADKDYEDLRLMSLCRHHIIANSTFSWWGAWLCPYPDKMVFAPKEWFNTSEKDIRGLIPDGWYQV